LQHNYYIWHVSSETIRWEYIIKTSYTVIDCVLRYSPLYYTIILLFFLYAFNILIHLFSCLQYFDCADSNYITYPLHYLFCIFVKYPTLNDIKSSFEEDKKSLIVFHDMHLKKKMKGKATLSLFLFQCAKKW
jgi:hypothetical protein